MVYAVKMTDSRYYTVYDEGKTLEQVAADIRERVASPNRRAGHENKPVRLEWVGECKVLRRGDFPKTSRPRELSEADKAKLEGLLS